jgi:hypothetical protein
MSTPEEDIEKLKDILISDIEPEPFDCEICGYPNFTSKIQSKSKLSLPSIQEHHIDGNHDNNTPSNLMYLCYNCHIELHALQKSKYSYLSDKEKINREAIQQLRDEKPRVKK